MFSLSPSEFPECTQHDYSADTGKYLVPKLITPLSVGLVSANELRGVSAATDASSRTIEVKREIRQAVFVLLSEIFQVKCPSLRVYLWFIHISSMPWGCVVFG